MYHSMEKIIPLNAKYFKDKLFIEEQQNKILALSQRLKILEDFIRRKASTQKIGFSTCDSVYYVRKNEIIYIKAEGSYACIYTQNGEKIIVSKPLKQVICKIDDDSFIRIHQSYYVNSKHIEKYNKANNSVELMNNITLPISRSHKGIMNQLI